MTRGIALGALVALLAATPGCSWVFTESVPGAHSPQLMPTCTAHRGTVAIDSTYAATLGIVALAVSDLDDADGEALATLFGVPAVLFAISAFVGLARTDECREARATHEQWLLHNRAGASPTMPERPVPTRRLGPPGAQR